jgi:hypothetical protein
MIGGPTATVLQPLRTIAGAGGGGGSDSGSVKADEATTTTVKESDEQRALRKTTARTTKSADGTATTAAAGTNPTTAPTAAPGGGSTATTTEAIADCKAADLTYATLTNKSTYSAGDTVDISLRVRNTSDRPCYAPVGCGVPLGAKVVNGEGATVWSGEATSNCSQPRTSGPLLGPRDAYNYGIVGQWDQHVCTDGTCVRAATGSYQAIGRRGNANGSAATFGLR